jgi:hypothetical protein
MGFFWTKQHWKYAQDTLAYKIFYRVLREKFLELTVELTRQSLIVRNDQSRLVEGGYDICHRKGLARTRDLQQKILSQNNLNEIVLREEIYFVIVPLV